MRIALFVIALLFAVSVQAGDRTPPPPEPTPQPSPSTTVSTSDEGRSNKKKYWLIGAAALGGYLIWSWDKPASDPKPTVQFGVRVQEHKGGK